MTDQPIELYDRFFVWLESQPDLTDPDLHLRWLEWDVQRDRKPPYTWFVRSYRGFDSEGTDRASVRRYGDQWDTSMGGIFNTPEEAIRVIDSAWFQHYKESE